MTKVYSHRNKCPMSSLWGGNVIDLSLSFPICKMGREMTSLCGFMEDWTMQHINCWDMPQTRQVLIDISYLPFSAWSLAGVPGWQRTNMNSLLHTVTSRGKVHGHSKEGNPPSTLALSALPLTASEQGRKESAGSGEKLDPTLGKMTEAFQKLSRECEQTLCKAIPPPLLLNSAACWFSEDRRVCRRSPSPTQRTQTHPTKN